MVINSHLTTYNQPPFANSIHWDALHSTVPSRPRHEDQQTDLSASILERLEKLDDVIFAAIDGDTEALDEAANTWQCTLDELGWDTVEESRQQYLRCAKSAWEAAREQLDEDSQYPFAAIEIIGMLVNVEP